MKFGMTVTGSNIGLAMEATCKWCGEDIKRRAQNGPWKHVDGGYECLGDDPRTTSRRAEPGTK